jgi:hypothetical protein
MDNAKILDYALNFLLANIDETTEEIEKGIEGIRSKT